VVDLWCHYENHTSDVIENQILSWTLRCISRSGLCAENVLSEVRRAYRSIQGLVTPKPISAADCIGRLYNRLNDDYEPLHALCRFFLEHSGPTLSAGQHDMLPFLIDMARLFELFVSEWLTVHLPDRFYLKPQEYVHLGPQGILSFRIDFVIYSTSTGKPICVADTKYKAQGKPTPDDFAQVVTYAKLKDCTHAFLIYPIRLPTELNVNMNDIRVQSLTFDLSYDLEKAGKKFIEALLKNIDV
jgi:5-methylcytosine-specific restriction enzyme subunit McrC